MAKARSPQYPAIGLKEAIEKVEAVYSKDYQNKTTREVVAKHMSYDSLHGKALSVLSALGKYGLLEGRGDETQVSDLAVKIIAHEPSHPERVAALKEAASKPELFAAIDKRFSDGKASDTAIRSYLLTQRFIPGAADLVIRSYRETKALVAEEETGYAHSSTQTGTRASPMPTPGALSYEPDEPFVPPPGKEPYRVSVTRHGLEVVARLEDAAAIDDLIRVLQAGKALITPTTTAFDAEKDDEALNH